MAKGNMQKNNSRRLMLIPRNISRVMLIVQAYLLLTIVLYVLGPWEWKDDNIYLTVGMLVVFQLALYFGFNSGKKYLQESKKEGFHFKPTTLKAILLFGLCITALQCVRTIGSIDPSVIMSRVLQGIADASSYYNVNEGGEGSFGGPVVTYLIVLSAPIAWMAIPLSIYHFEKLSCIYRIVAVSTILLEVSRWISVGTNKGAIDVLLTIVAVVILKYASKSRMLSKVKPKTKSKRKKAVAVLLIILLLSAGVSIFVNNTGSRIDNNWINLEITNGQTQINDDSILMMMCPEPLHPALILVSSYLSQGYYALSLTRLVEWIPTFGAGNSMFIMENIKELFGVDLFQYTYQLRLEVFGWDSLVNWHSFYVWVANDVSLFGIVIVMFAIGYVFFRVTCDAILRGDDIAIALFCLFFLMFFYIPANNQIMSYPTSFMAFWVLIVVWQCTSRRNHFLLKKI